MFILEQWLLLLNENSRLCFSNSGYHRSWKIWESTHFSNFKPEQRLSSLIWLFSNQLFNIQYLIPIWKNHIYYSITEQRLSSLLECSAQTSPCPKNHYSKSSIYVAQELQYRNLRCFHWWIKKQRKKYFCSSDDSDSLTVIWIV